MRFRDIFAIAMCKLLAQKVAASLLTLSPTLFVAFLAAQDYFAKYLADPTGKIAILTTALSMALAPLPIAVYFYFKPSVIFNKHLQIYVDVKTDVPYCPSCKDGHKRLAKLMRREPYWECSVKECRMRYYNPDYVPPKKDETPRSSAYG